MKILGISAFYHDSAACLIVDGKIVSAAQEERFTRKKHDQNFPINAIKFCLENSLLVVEDINFIVFYDKPFLKFERIFESYLAFAPRGFQSFLFSLPKWLKEKLFQKKILLNNLESNFGKAVNWKERLLFSEHHLSHAASAFFASPFEEAAVLTMDGVGEWVTTSLAIGNKNSLIIKKEISFPHSLGLLYSAFTYYLGFKVNSGEYKVMGLAPYGEPIYARIIEENLIFIKNDGSFRLDMSYFNYCTSLEMTSEKFHKLFGSMPRLPESALDQRHMDLAASIQQVLEKVILKIALSIRNTTGQKNLCLAGGVALNCVANGKLIQEKIFDNIWIQPAAGDAGGAIGAGLAAYHLMMGLPRTINVLDSMNGAFLGPSYKQSEVEDTLNKIGAKYEVCSTDDELLDRVVTALIEGKAVGWHQGRMEFGPRSLGSRSIIADPRSPTVQKKLNLKVKYRESFRPFAPSILEEEVSNWFELNQVSPYMLFVANVITGKRKKLLQGENDLFGLDKINVCRSEIPAVTHIDYSARVQTVSKHTNKKFYDLLSKFNDATGCPVLVNTSFNVRGEPIVCNPEDSYRCFMGSDIELLVIENCILEKELQNIIKRNTYFSTYALD